MATTTYAAKCEILGTLWMFYRETEDETWSEFFEWADLGLPLSYHVWQGYSTLKPEGRVIVDETWATFCEMVSIDPDAKYENLKAAFEASPNDPLEDDD